MSTLTRSASCSPVGLVVQRGVAAGARLQRVEEVEDDLGQRQRVAQLDAVVGQVVHAQQVAAPGLAQLHDRADVARSGRRIVARTIGSRTSATLPSGNSRGVGDLDARGRRPGSPGRRRSGAVEIRSRSNSRSSRSRTISRCSRPRKPQRKPKPSATGGLRLVDQRGVVELAACPARRAAPGSPSRRSGTGRRRPSAWGRGSRRAPRWRRLRAAVTVSPTRRLADVLHAGDQVADLADAEARGRASGSGEMTPTSSSLVDGAGGHHLDPLARWRACRRSPGRR